MLEYKCSCCNFTSSNIDEFEKHVKENHFLSVNDLFELGEIKRNNCYKCNKSLVPLTYIDSSCDFYLPCWDCVSDKKYEKTQALNTTRSAILDFYNKIVGDRYFQMFIIDNNYYKTTRSHKFEEFKEVLKLLQKDEKKDRNKIWFIDYKEGYPNTICSENIEGLKIVTIDDRYKVISKGETLMINEKYELKFTEKVNYDQRHHSRYNILNDSSDPRKSKRLKLSTEPNKCIKFFNSPEDERIKSLFQIQNFRTGEYIPLSSINKADFVVIKLLLLRNKTYIKLIFEVIGELLKNIGTLRDSVFLKNTVMINPDNSPKINFMWTPENYIEDYINISIL